MKMRSICLLLLLLSLHQVLPQSPPGFISLDCGLRGTNGYNILGLYYSTDEAYIETGKGRSISPEFTTSSLPRNLLYVRSFPGPVGSRYCYTLRPLYGKGNKILLRVSFMYGNYDDQNKLPQFDIHLGVDFWEKVTLRDSSSVFVKEILHIPTSDYLHLCLVNTGNGTPFISVLELRPMDPLVRIYNTTSGSLELLARLNLGSTSNDYLRYKDGDPFDRIWQPFNPANTTGLTTTATSFIQNVFNTPPSVLRTAAEARTMTDSFIFTILPNNPSDQVYVYTHFAELVANQSREITAYINGFKWYGPFVTPYLFVISVQSDRPTSQPSYEFKISATSNSKLPPILNAVEVYTVKQFPHYETEENDVSAIISIKATYAITRNWQGDPCSPQNFTWVGINCSYNGFDHPNIISMNLSSSGIVGTIAPSISNLTMLQSLDLSYNNLTGQVPDFLSKLPFLRYLYIQGNNFSGSLPPTLLEKSKNGSLDLRVEIFSNSTNHCANDACKNVKNSNVVFIAASVAGIIAILILSTLVYIFVRRKRQVIQRVMVESNKKNAGGSSIEPTLRQFTFSEVTSMIAEKKVLGEGGFGNVFNGCMNGLDVAVKLLKMSPLQENTDFQSEVKILSTVHHRNLTRIVGYCNEGINRAIIFELMENGNLKKYLSDGSPNVLSWELRLSIMIDAAQGLEYLHHGCDPPIIHRDIKPENILLTKEFEAKLADFGLSRIFPVQTSRVMGTFGYHDPLYNQPGTLTEKIDIYSFGVVMLVVVTGQPAIIQQTTHITQWIAPKIRNGDIEGIVDPRLQGNYDVNVVWRVIELAVTCVSKIPSRRPSMHHVVKELKECLQTITEGSLPSTMESVFRPSGR